VQAALWCSLAFGLALAVLGAPAALALRAAGQSVAATAGDAVMHGTLALTMTILADVWGGRPGLIVFIAGYLAVVGVVLVRRRADVRPALSLRRLRMRWWVWVLLALLVIAAAARLRYINIIPWTGDMGGYVNWANLYARTGKFTSGFPPLFTIWLASGTKLFGTAHTAATTPLLGMMFLFGLLRLCGQLRVAPAVRIAVLILAAASQHALWFSSFPASESLQAPLMMFLLTLFIEATRSHGARLAGLVAFVGLTSAALSLNRAQALLLVIPLALVVLSCFARVWARYAWRVALVASASVIGLYVGYLYGIRRIHTYYILQVTGQLSAHTFKRLDDAGVFRTSATLIGLMALSVAFLLVVGWLAGRRAGGPSTSGRAGVLAWPLPYLALMALVQLGTMWIGRHDEVAQAIIRVGLWLPISAALSILIGKQLRGSRAIAVHVAFTTATLFLFLHEHRLGVPRSHLIFLYWDRYLFSEFMPMSLVVAAVGLTALLARRAVAERRRVVVPAIIVAALVGTLPYAHADHKQTLHTMLSGAYGFEKTLAHTVSATSAPVMWSATSKADLPGIFPNSWYSFGVPLSMSFGTPMVNVTRANAFGSDQIIGTSDITAQLSCAKPTLWVIDVVKRSGPILEDRAKSDAYTLTFVRTVTATLPTIAQGGGNNPWVMRHLTAQVWRVSKKGC
jgi:hypothetical protein